jgi:ATP-dependent RNA helicase DHX57
VTQPRRIAAIGLAQRVSYELCESVGSTVGYAIRLEGKSSPSTQVLYCTTGVLLKKLENSQGPISKLLNEYSHIIIDEVHERSIEIDFILLILKHLISARTDLKVILMSATANVAALAQYFGGNPPIVNVPGRAYLVETLHLEDILSLIPYSPKGEYRSQRSKARARNEDGLGPDDDCVSIEELKNLYPDKSNAVLHSLQKIDQAVIQYPLIINLILYCIEYFQGTRMFKTKAKRIEENRSVSRYRCILVFLPGFQEILDLRSLLLKEEAILNVTNGGRNCLALHSSVSTSDQRRVFEEPDDDHVKIILATNIAETSLTIPDVCIVIDSGKMKEARYDSSKGIVSLEECWISKASGLQRAGRAGRVCAGICLRIYSSKKADKFENEQTPEVHRTPLEQLLLRIKVLPSLWSSSLLDVVKQLIDPPPLNSIRVAMRSLQSLKVD